MTSVNREAFNAYTTYLSLKNHFTKFSYDYFKYQGKVNVREETFDKRKDKWYFYKLSKKSDLPNYIMINLFENPKIWVGEMLEKDDVYIAWKKRTDALTHYFKSDLNKLDDNFRNDFIVQQGDYPKALEKYLDKEIIPETLILINKFVPIFQHWSEKVTDTLMYPSINMRLVKYDPFVEFDRDKIKNAFLAKYK